MTESSGWSARRLDNDAMLRLNHELGARIVHVPDDPGYMLCVFDLR